ncbi:MAG: endolytic transglycosylase MltG [Candidatus Aminicenantes bacterium]|nr:endolytic transglycosylase MltG [Candidatus Aminicenantes bacterium]
MKRIILVSLVIFLIIALILGVDINKKVFKPYKGYEKPVTIQIEQGSSVSSIAKHLFKKKIIASYTYFTIYYRLFFSSLPLKTGEYKFEKALTMKQVITKLNTGKVLLYKRTIKEGMTIAETAAYLENYHDLDKDRFLKACQNTRLIDKFDSKANDLEGYLFPETYLVPRATTEEQIVNLMIQKFKETFSHSLYWRAMDLKFSMRDVITLASLIEKETSSREERFLISSVFHNRLKIGMPLACDPTIIYILEKENRYTGRLRWKDLKLKSPYNTRINKGLPPGPICSPGFASIEAALYPENTEYLYFVAKDSNTHYFSKTLREHNWAVRKYIINKGI